MRRNRFREAIAAGRIPIGHMIMEFGTRGIARLLEGADLDFVVFDMEHSGFDVDRLADLLAWSHGCSYAPFVRVPQGQYHFLARIMDAGALGVMIANVQTPEQAAEVVSYVKYPPVGVRGVALGIAHNDYVMPDPAAYYEEINKSSVVICQIESGLGVKNSQAIAAVPGVDCLWVGHYDLTTSLGIPGQFKHKQYLDSLRAVVEASRNHSKRSGIQPGNAEQAAEWHAIGFDVLSWSADFGVYRTALQNEVKSLKTLATAKK